MAEDDHGEKTEPATAKKRQDARKRGTVAKSQDLTTAAVMLGAVLVFWFYGKVLVEELAAMMKLILANLASFEQMNQANTLAFAGKGLVKLILLLAPMVLVIFVLATAVSLLQVGWFFSFEPLSPRWSKLNPISGLKNVFGMNGWVKLVQSLLKMSAIAAVLAWTLVDEFPRMPALLGLEISQIMAYMGDVTFTLALRTAIVLLLIGLIDLTYQRWKYEKDMRMSKFEIKEEMRMLEGDPQIKQRRRRAQMELALKRMMGEVPTADVVITNPTHLAIAIRYDAGAGPAPKVVAKGAGHIAERIRELALEHRVPLVEKKELAQALYAAVEVGDYVPEQFWQAVAEILAYVYRLSGKVAG